jgi:sodium/bile acid cotransporter 7
LIGLLLTPLPFGFTSHLYGGAIDVFGVWEILGELWAPFVVGHLLRPWIGAWAARSRSVLAVTDRGLDPAGRTPAWRFISALGVSWRRG